MDAPVEQPLRVPGTLGVVFDAEGSRAIGTEVVLALRQRHPFAGAGVDDAHLPLGRL